MQVVTFICETWYILLWVTSPAPGDLLALTPSTWVARKCPSAGSLGKRHCPSMVAKMAVRVYVYMSVCLCVLLMSHTVYT